MQLSVEPNPRVPCRVVHSDPHFLVIDKPAGVVTQPGVGHQRDTLLNFAFAHHGKALQALGKARDYGLLHRLDRPTSGLVAVGLTREGYDALRARFVAREVFKRYVTLVHGAPRPRRGTIRDPLREARRGGRKLAVVGAHPRAKTAVTHYRPLASGRGLSLLECEIETGRLHQIRVHLAHRGCPVVGDRDYGRRSETDKTFARATRKAIFLHAGELAFDHPVAGGRITTRVPLPERHRAFLADVGVDCPRSWR